MTELFKVGINLLGAGVVLKMTKQMGDRLTEDNKKCKHKKRYIKL